MPDPSFRQFRDAATFRPEVWRSFARWRPLERERHREQSALDVEAASRHPEVLQVIACRNFSRSFPC
jgi:hypothetical protein